MTRRVQAYKVAWFAGNDALGWGDESVGVESAEGLVAAPGKVERIAISYAQASKQVGLSCPSNAPWLLGQSLRLPHSPAACSSSSDVLG